ncbi:hypothetical protein BGX20_001761, partial [Mortierella sp. AD010]
RVKRALALAPRQNKKMIDRRAADGNAGIPRNLMPPSSASVGRIPSQSAQLELQNMPLNVTTPSSALPVTSEPSSLLEDVDMGETEMITSVQPQGRDRSIGKPRRERMVAVEIPQIKRTQIDSKKIEFIPDTPQRKTAIKPQEIRKVSKSLKPP